MPSLSSTPNFAPLRLLHACAALLILVLLATNATVILHLRESELLREEEQLKNLSLTLAEQADRSFRAVDLAVASIAERIADEGAADAAAFARELGGRDTHLRLGEKIAGIPQLDAITLIGGDGRLVNFSRAWPVPEIDVSDRDYFRALKADPDLTRFISAPVLNRVTGAWTIFLARPVRSAHGEFVGLVLGPIEMRYFDDFYRAITLGEGNAISVQRLDGTLLARFPPTDAIGKTFGGAGHLLQDGISGTRRELSPIDGQMRLKAAHRLPNFPVMALATKTAAAALANWWNIARLMTLGALGCAASIAAAGYAFGRQLRQRGMLAEAQAELRRQDDLRAALEAMRRAKEAAELADRGKSEFPTNMSHELRTPLNAVLGFSEMLVTEVFGPLGNERYRGYAKDIHASGSHLLGIVNKVLDLSKAAAGKLELVEDWVDARELVQSVCRFIRPRLDAGGLSLTVVLPQGDIVVLADERLLRQMLLNLLSNASKFTAPDGRVDLAVAVDDAGVAFAVTDTGIGIPAADLERVMLPFVQVDSSLGRRHDGTGLGLALVKAMAELHGGTLDLASAVGQGTTATVTLPRARLRPARPETAAFADAIPRSAA